MNNLEKAILVSHTRAKGTIDGESINYDIDLPKPGEVPFEQGLYSEPMKPDLEWNKGDKQGGGGVNRNAAHLEKMRHFGRITESQYGAGCRYRRYWASGYPGQSHEIRENVDRSISNDMPKSRAQSIKRLCLAADMMNYHENMVVHMIAVMDLAPQVIAQRMAGKLKGFSINRRNARIGKCLDKFDEIWPLTRIDTQDID